MEIQPLPLRNRYPFRFIAATVCHMEFGFLQLDCPSDLLFCRVQLTTTSEKKNIIRLPFGSMAVQFIALHHLLPRNSPPSGFDIAYLCPICSFLSFSRQFLAAYEKPISPFYFPADGFSGFPLFREERKMDCRFPISGNKKKRLFLSKTL